MPDMSRLKNLGPLHNLMLRACPPNADNIKSVTILAKKTGHTRGAIYKAIWAGKVTPEMATRILKVADKSAGVTPDDFRPYVSR